MIGEWVGPRCSRPGITRSMSDMTDASNSNGTFTFIFISLDVAFPHKYPMAKCPTAYVDCSSCFCKAGLAIDIVCFARATYVRA